MGLYVAGGMLAAIGGLMEGGNVASGNNAPGYQEGIILMCFAAAA